MKQKQGMLKRLLAGLLGVTMTASTLGVSAFAIQDVLQPQPKEVLEWTWQEDLMPNWDEETQSWVLGMAYTDDPLLNNAEVLAQELPKYIQAQVESSAVVQEETPSEDVQPASEEYTGEPEQGETPVTGTEEEAAVQSSATPAESAHVDGTEGEPVPYTDDVEDTDPDSGESTEPGTDPDNGESTEPGTDPDNGESTEPDTDPDNGESTDPGTDPDNGESTEPGTDPDNGESTDPGTDPDNGEPADPGTDSDNGEPTEPDADNGEQPEADQTPVVTTEQLELTWDLSALTFPLEEGIYSVTATLPDGYVLAEGAPQLTITLQFGDGVLFTELPSGTPPYSDKIVNGVSPNGTTIDLFDYWITSQTAADNEDPWQNNVNLTLTSGINDGHALVFGKSLGNYNAGAWNTYTGGSSPRTGIVSNKLVDGYPQLDVNTSLAGSPISGRNGSESLAYLFDPDVTSAGKASYEDVQGLLQVDSDGYYYYNSTENYAVYYQDQRSFVLYEYPGVRAAGASGVTGQFFPFNVATEDGKHVGNQRLMNAETSEDSSLNHYFGMHMSTRFIQQNEGYTDATKKTAVTYEFSGDDDVWIFIDGTLVADLGGIHGATSVSINFATGIITINGRQQSTKLGRYFGSGDTLPNNTYHTLDFFYLERGNVDSNMNLKYNLVTIPESSMIKVDQLGDPVPGTTFKLYAADDYEQYGEAATAIATGTTDRDGEFVFLDNNDFPITIESLYNTYKDRGDAKGNNLILAETDTPAGYRTCGEIGLYFYATKADEVLLLSNSVWDEGAYAMPKVTATTPNVIRNADNPGQTVTLVGTNAVENPLMFAVVFQKQNNGSWYPVSGDPLNGWEVAENSNWNSILAAARANPYIFQLASSGAYQVEVSNLPGDIKTYYHICQNLDDAKYTIGYYYTTAATLAGATESNTWRIDSDPTDGAKQYGLDRVFSMDVYVTNIKNRLLVQKVDDENNPVNGASFALYEADDVTVNQDGTVTVHANATVYDSLTTANVSGILNLNGGGIFPTGSKVLELGEYYLIETSAPGGYVLNDTAVHVIVDNTGVYADAGTTDDGVTVLRGVGSVMRSMVQFAADDHVDTTLNGIKAALATNVSYTGDSFTWDSANWSEEDVLHLQFANANKMLDYGLYDGTGGTIDDLTLATEEGWSKLLIQQCYRHDDTVDATLKTDLKDMDITNLFSGTVTVRVVNDRTGNLKISKVVEGENAPADQEFTFTVTVKDGQTAISGEYATVGGNGTITFTDGTATVTLKAGESLTILALPTDAAYTVTETAVSGFTSSITVTGDDNATNQAPTVTGTIQHNTTETDAVVLTYTNTFDGNARLVLNGTKTLDGRNLTTSDQFTFTLTAADSYADVVLPTTTTVTVKGDDTANSSNFSFDEIVFKAEGTYTFNIQENLPSGVDAGDPTSDGIRYDTHTAVVTVVVTRDNQTGILSAVAIYSNAGAPSESDAAEITKAAFTNTYESLTISKTVTGDMGDKSADFDFQITCTTDPTLSGSYDYNGSSLTFSNGTATFQLKHGQTITIIGLPNGTYTISEPDAVTDGYTVTIGGDATSAGEVTLDGAKTVQVAVENHREVITPTGLVNDTPIFQTMVVAFGAAALVIGGGWFLVWRRKRREWK